MAKLAGGFLRIFTTLLYFLAFCCAGVVLGIYSYFLAKLSIHHIGIKQKWRAVEGLSGAGVLYTIFAVLLTVFLGGHRFFAFLGIVLDVLFCGAFIALAVLTDDGDSSCNGIVTTPLGTGDRNAQAAGTSLHYACKLNTAAFAVSIIGAFMFLLCAVFQVLVARHHQKEKRYGPSPANNYTSGSGGKFWKRRKPKTTHEAYKDGEVGASGLAPPPANNARTSHETGYTGTTMGQNDTYATKYDAGHSGYHTGPTGTSVNPYAYQNQPHATGTAVNY